MQMGMNLKLKAGQQIVFESLIRKLREYEIKLFELLRYRGAQSVRGLEWAGVLDFSTSEH